MRLSLVLTSTLCLAVIPTAVMAQQCPDGTPPPCSRRAPAAPSLDERTWLVLPFDNIAHDPALDVVRDASVTLLYGAMSQWTDVRVVDDTRVTDLMRGVPVGTRLGQDAGFDLARRVGAGKLVMGTLLKEGARTRVQAAVFDVRTGRRLRTPSAVMVGTDSLSAMFGTLAERVLALPVPPGIRAADVGTQSTEALQAYAGGLDAEWRGEPDSAVMHYGRAVEIDSSFGLAHYRIYWNVTNYTGQFPGFTAAEQDRALQAAFRFGAGMPRRERGQVAALAAAGRGDWRGACADADRMIAADSLDAWAYWMRGRCRRQLLVGDTGTVLARFRSDNAAIADWRRAAALDPTFNAPVLRIFDLLTGISWVLQRSECVRPVGPCPDPELWTSGMLLDHDTLVYHPYVWATARHLWAQEPGQFDAHRRRYELARDLMAAFVAANPRNWAGHAGLSIVLGELGDLDGARAEDRMAVGVTRWRLWRFLWLDLAAEWMLRLERPGEAMPYADSSLSGGVTIGVAAGLGTIFGRYAGEATAYHGGNDSLVVLRRTLLPLWAGILPADVDSLAARYGEAYGRRFRDPQVRESIRRGIAHTVDLLAFRMRRTRPAADTADPHPIVRSQAWFALGDTVRSRRELALAEAEVDRRPAWAWDDGSWLFLAEGYVLLGDSAAALRRLRDLAARWRTMASWVHQLLGEYTYIWGGVLNIGSRGLEAAGREWLLYGDLAAASGDAAQARRAYRFVVGLWDRGDAPVQPLVERARAALVRLGN